MNKKLFLLFILFFVTGCQSNIVTKAGTNMSKLDSYYYDTEIVIESNVDGVKKSIIKNTSVDNDVSYSINKAISFNTSEYVSYYKDGNTYFQSDDIWFKQKKNDLIDFSLFKKAKIIENNDNVYKISLDNEEELINNIFELRDYNLSVDEISLIIQDDKILNISISAKSEDYVCTIKISYSKYNEDIDVDIPSTVIDSANEYEVYEKKLNINEYLNKIKTYLFNNDYDSDKYNNTDLEFDGVKPSVVNLSIENNLVKDGVIEADGYKATIVNGNINKFEKISN